MPKFSDARTGRFCAATFLYSLTGTFRHHEIDPLAYVQYILQRLPSLPTDQPNELLRGVCFASHTSGRRKEAA